MFGFISFDQDEESYKKAWDELESALKEPNSKPYDGGLLKTCLELVTKVPSVGRKAIVASSSNIAFLKKFPGRLASYRRNIREQSKLEFAEIKASLDGYLDHFDKTWSNDQITKESSIRRPIVPSIVLSQAIDSISTAVASKADPRVGILPILRHALLAFLLVTKNSPQFIERKAQLARTHLTKFKMTDWEYRRLDQFQKITSQLEANLRKSKQVFYASFSTAGATVRKCRDSLKNLRISEVFVPLFPSAIGEIRKPSAITPSIPQEKPILDNDKGYKPIQLSEEQLQASSPEVKIGESGVITGVSWQGKEFMASLSLAGEFDYDVDHLGYLARQGKIEGLKWNKRWYITRASLGAYKKKIGEQKAVTALQRLGIGSAPNKSIQIKKNIQGNQQAVLAGLAGIMLIALIFLRGPSGPPVGQTAGIFNFLSKPTPSPSSIEERLKAVEDALKKPPATQSLVQRQIQQTINQYFTTPGLPQSTLNQFNQKLLGFQSQLNSFDAKISEIAARPITSSPGSSTVVIVPLGSEFNGTAVRGGNVHLSSNNITTTTGNLTIQSTGGLTILADSLIQLGGVSYDWPAADGSNGQVLTTDSSGTLSWTTVSGGGSGADTDIPFITVGNTSSLSFERALAGTSSQITVTDGGANGNITLSIPSLFSITTASLSSNFEAVGYASASKYFGATLSGCASSGNVLRWSTTGLFSCATLVSGDIPSLSATYLTVTGGTLSGNLTGTGASFSTNFEVGGYASVGGNGTFKGTLGVTGATALSSSLGVTGLASFANASLSGDFELTGGSSVKFGINAGNLIDTMLEVGGAASISGNITTLGSYTQSGIGTNTITGRTTFSGGVSLSSNFEITNASEFGINSGAITESTFEIGDSTTTSGVVASISASGVTTGTGFQLNADALSSGRGFKLSSIAAFTGSLFSLTANGVQTGSIASISTNSLTSGNLFNILASGSTITGNIFNVTAKGLGGGGSILKFTVPASSSGTNRHILLVTDSAGAVVASWNNGGRLAIKANIKSRGSNSVCTGVNTGGSGCIDYAESFPSTDSTIIAGELVSADTSVADFQNVVRTTGDNYSSIIGVVSTNPAALITGSEFKTGSDTAEPTPGYVPVALAGRVPVKVSAENGRIKAGDRLTASVTLPGYAMKATKSGMTIGMALSDMGDGSTGTVLEFVNLSYWTPSVDDLISDLASTDSTTATPDHDGLLAWMLGQFQDLFDLVIKKGVIQTVRGIFDTVEVQKGVTTYDRATGEAYCIGIENGAVVTTKGKCDQAAPSTNSDSTSDSSGTTVPETSILPVIEVTPSVEDEIVEPPVPVSESLPPASDDTNPESTTPSE